MPFNGSGTFTIDGSPFVADTPALAEEVNAKLDDIADGLSDVITRNGQSPPTTNLPMGNFKLTGLGAATARTDAVNLGQLQDGAATWDAVSSGAANVYQVDLTPAITAYADGMRVRFKAHQASTGACTINVNGVGAKDLRKVTTSQALASGEIALDQVVEAVYVSAADVFVVASATTAIPLSIVRVARTGNTALAASNRGQYIDVTSGTFTQTLDAAATLGSGWFVYYGNSGTGTVTLDPNSGETIDGQTTVSVPTGKKLLIQCDGSNFYSVLASDDRLYQSSRTSNTILGVADFGQYINITSGTFTQTFAAAATLGNGWWCYIRNSGTGDITLDPNSSETIDGLTSYIMYPGECRLVQCSGSALFSVVVQGFVREFASSASWTKPPGYVAYDVDLWSGGGGGGSGRRGATGANLGGGGGGGGGARNQRQYLASELAATEPVVIGAGGAGGAAISTDSTDGSAGSIGGNTTFSSGASLLTAFGGGSGAGGGRNANSAAGGGGGGVLGAGGVSAIGGEPILPSQSNGNGQFGGGFGGDANTATAGLSAFGGGGGGRGFGGSGVDAASSSGGQSAYSGGGGGGGGGINSSSSLQPASSGGTGRGAGGAGGAASTSGAATAGTAGSVRGGGGGGGGASVNGNNSGAGGAGGNGYAVISGVI